MTALMTAILQPWEHRALQKHLSRLQDHHDLESGTKTPEQLRLDNSHFREVAHEPIEWEKTKL